LRELEWVTLEEARELDVLYAREDSPKFDRAAVRWLARFALEGRDVGRLHGSRRLIPSECKPTSEHRRRPTIAQDVGMAEMTDTRERLRLS